MIHCVLTICPLSFNPLSSVPHERGLCSTTNGEWTMLMLESVFSNDCDIIPNEEFQIL
jgi:hypothetical protein